MENLMKRKESLKQFICSVRPITFCYFYSRTAAIRRLEINIQSMMMCLHSHLLHPLFSLHVSLLTVCIPAAMHAIICISAVSSLGRGIPVPVVMLRATEASKATDLTSVSHHSSSPLPAPTHRVLRSGASSCRRAASDHTSLCFR